MRAADTALARANARAFVADFIGGRGDAALARPTPGGGAPADRLPVPVAPRPRRADHAFYQAFLKAIGKAARDLEGDLRRSISPQARLLAAVALCYAGLCCEGIQPILAALHPHPGAGTRSPDPARRRASQPRPALRHGTPARPASLAPELPLAQRRPARGAAPRHRPDAAAPAPAAPSGRLAQPLQRHGRNGRRPPRDPAGL